MNKTHYLDNAATSAALEDAANAAFKCMTEIYGNPSSVHEMGLKAAKLLKQSRETVAKAFGCKPEELFFTSGGTESINTALMSSAHKFKSKLPHIVTTSVEHHATLNTLKRLEQSGFDVTYVRLNKNGSITAEDILQHITDKTGIVSIMAVNNETGEIFPISEIKRRLAEINPQIILHCDMVQGFLKSEASAVSCGADLISVSGHKIGAPKGSGALYIRKGLHLTPFITGGGQENGMRSGTENLPAIAGLAEACRIRLENISRDTEHIANLNLMLREKIKQCFENAVFISSNNASPHIFCFSLPNIKSEVAVRMLSDKGIYVSNGSACAKGKKSHVLSELNLPSKVIDGAIRVSFCPENTAEDIDAFVAAFADVIKIFN